VLVLPAWTLPAWTLIVPLVLVLVAPVVRGVLVVRL
jgi:hypothetical protein